MPQVSTSGASVVCASEAMSLSKVCWIRARNSRICAWLLRIVATVGSSLVRWLWTRAEDESSSDDALGSTAAAPVSIGSPSSVATISRSGVSPSSPDSSEDGSSSAYPPMPVHCIMPISRRVTSQSAKVLIFSSPQIAWRRPIFKKSHEMCGPTKMAPIHKYWL